jgi:hypothetical protein
LTASDRPSSFSVTRRFFEMGGSLAELLAERGPLAELFLADGLVERAHRDGVARLLPLRDDDVCALGPTITDGRADGREDRVLGVELAKLVLDGVVGRVGDEGLMVVVGVLVLLDERDELVDALFGGGHRHGRVGETTNRIQRGSHGASSIHVTRLS